jgi:hypothetical protein
MQTEQHLHDGTARAAHAAGIAKQLDILREAVRMLTAAGHTILSAGVGNARPFVFLAPSAKLGAIADQGRAAYWMHGIDEDGQRYRKGQLIDYRNVLVTWTERGH